MSHFCESPIVGRGHLIFASQKQKVQSVPAWCERENNGQFKKAVFSLKEE